MTIFQIIITIISFALSFLSLIASISPNTPLGKKIYAKLIFSNKKIDLFFIFYKKFIFYFFGGLILAAVYLLFSVIDFYITQATTFNIIYFSLIAAIILFIFTGHNKFISNLIKKSIYLISYLIIIITYFYLTYNYSFDESIKNQYSELRRATPIDEVMLKDSSSDINGYVNNYQNYIIFSSYLNRVMSHYGRSGVKPIMSLDKNTKTSTEQRFLEELLIKHVQSSFDPDYQKVIFSRADAVINNTIFYKNILPIQLEPRYISSTIIYNHSYVFSRVSITTKIFIINLYNKINKRLTIYLGFFIVLQMLFLAYLLAIAIKRYNLKYDSSFSDENSYSFTIIGIMGIVVGTYAILI
ncbi:MAG: hypothetical protein WBP46_05290 [Thiolinea sp.]